MALLRGISPAWRKLWLTITLVQTNFVGRVEAATTREWKFPSKITEIQLDLIGLLTVIGESAMSLHAQTVTASLTCLLPRLLPAPQALLIPERHRRLPFRPDVTTVGIESGNKIDSLHFFPNLLLEVDALKPFQVQEISIQRSSRNDATTKTSTTSEQNPSPETDPKDNTGNSQLTPATAAAPASSIGVQILPRILGITTALTVIGALMSIGLILFAIFFGDGMAVVGLSLLSLTSTLTGLGSYWKVKLTSRKESRKAPPGDILLKTSQGAFIIIHCDETITRELFMAPEGCDYLFSEEMFRIFAGLGTFTLMAGVVSLANCTWELQAAIGAAYVLLNALYWVGAVLPKTFSWDLGMYLVEPVAPIWDGPPAYPTPVQIVNGEEKRFLSYTDALREVVIRTKGKVEWGMDRDIVPKTDVWKEWLDEAGRTWEDKKWDARKRWTELHNMKKSPPPPLVETRQNGEVVVQID